MPGHSGCRNTNKFYNLCTSINKRNFKMNHQFGNLNLSVPIREITKNMKEEIATREKLFLQYQNTVSE